MGEIIQTELKGTLRRIKTALNKRYEKDAEMYISYQETLEIKHHLFNHEFSELKDMINSGSVSKTVLARIVIKNLWLITDFDKETKKNLNEIFSYADPEILKEIKAKCDDGSIEINSEIKMMLLKYAYVKSDVDECIEYLESDDSHDNNLLEMCFRKVLLSIDDADEQFEFIDEYFDKYPSLIEKRDILLELTVKCINDDNEEYKNYLVEKIKDYINEYEEPLKPYQNALFKYDDAYDIIDDMFDSFSRGYHFNFKRINIVCEILRSYIRQLKDEKLEPLLRRLANDYDSKNENIQNCIDKKVFLYKGYPEKVSKILFPILEEELGELPYSVNQEIENASMASKIDTAEKLVQYMESNRLSYKGNDSWFNFIFASAFKGIKPHIVSEILVDLLIEYADDYDEFATTFLPDFFRIYVERAKANDEPFQSLMRFFHAVEIGDFANKNLYPVDENTWYDINQNKYMIDQIKDIVISTAITKNIRFGGINSPYYNYLYDFRRADCKKIFDV